MKIVSHKHVGKKQTYNLRMASDHHNYLLDSGVVSANSHGISYGLITYQTAYLKANYISEYMTALISFEEDPEQQAAYMADAKYNFIEIKPPNLNESNIDFIVNNNGDILFGFNAIKGLGKRAVSKVIKMQPYKGFGDFLIRAWHEKGVNKKVIDSLIDSGACDSFGFKRSCMIAHYQKFVVDYIATFSEDKVSYDSLHAHEYIQKNEEKYFKNSDIAEYPILKILEKEKSILGTYMSGNPFDIIKQVITEKYNLIDEIKNKDHGTYVILSQINKLQVIKTRKGDDMAFIDLLDPNNEVLNVVMFPNIYNKYKEILHVDMYILSYVNIQVKQDRGKSYLLHSIRDLTDSVKLISNKIEDKQNLRNIVLLLKQCNPIKLKGVIKKIGLHESPDKSNYSVTLVGIIGNISFVLKKIYVEKININVLRAFNNIKDIEILRE